MTKSYGLLACCLTLAAVAVAEPSNAAAQDTPSIAVSFADLDISHTAGAKILLRRIRAASEQVCGGPPDMRLMEERIAVAQCSDPLVAAAVARVNSPQLTALAGRDAKPVRVVGR